VAGNSISLTCNRISPYIRKLDMGASTTVARLTTNSAVGVSIKQRKSVLCSLSPKKGSVISVTNEEMHRLYQERERVFQTRYMGMRWPEPEPTQMFTIYGGQRRREVVRPSFTDMSYDELVRLMKINERPWFDEMCRAVNTPPAEDTELTPEDTKELDDFLNSFTKK